jgi:hypothetical protein
LAETSVMTIIYNSSHTALDLILRLCNKEVVADPAYNLYGPPTPGTRGVPSIVTRKRTICDRRK